MISSTFPNGAWLVTSKQLRLRVACCGRSPVQNHKNEYIYFTAKLHGLWAKTREPTVVRTMKGVGVSTAASCS